MSDPLPTAEQLHQTVELVLRYQAGDDQELSALFARLQPRILRMARFSMGASVRQKWESIDVAQDVALDLMGALRDVRIEEPGHLVLWLASVVRNNVRGKARELRALKRDQDLEVAIDASRAGMSGEGFRQQLQAFDELPLEQLTRQEDADLVDEAITALRGEEQQIIALRSFASLSYRAIAKHMGLVSEEAAAARYVRALSKLKRELTRRGLRSES